MTLWCNKKLRQLCVALCLCLGFTSGAHSSPVIADLSAYHVDIDSSFRGTRLFLFGARNDPGRLYIVLRGPNQTYTVRKKERMLGIWLVGQQVTFENVPQLYTVIGAKNNFDPAIQPYLAALNIGFDHIPMLTKNTVDEKTRLEFSQALADIKRKQKLYAEQSESLRTLGQTLFKANLDFPDSISRGAYTADVYLLDEQGVVGMQSLPIDVKQKGLEAFISNAAQQFPMLYGLCAVGVALLLGWGANTLLRRLNLN